MTESDRHPHSSGSGIARLWQRAPILIRAIVVGFVVFEIGVVAWAMILAPLVPTPWSVLAMGGVLWLYWIHFSGSWWPRTTFNFSFWWSDLAGTFDKQTIAETGIDTHFVVWALILVASIALFTGTARKTLTSRQRIETVAQRI